MSEPKEYGSNDVNGSMATPEAMLRVKALRDRDRGTKEPHNGEEPARRDPWRNRTLSLEQRLRAASASAMVNGFEEESLLLLEASDQVRLLTHAAQYEKILEDRCAQFDRLLDAIGVAQAILTPDHDRY